MKTAHHLALELFAALMAQRGVNLVGAERCNEAEEETHERVTLQHVPDDAQEANDQDDDGGDEVHGLGSLSGDLAAATVQGQTATVVARDANRLNRERGGIVAVVVLASRATAISTSEASRTRQLAETDCLCDCAMSGDSLKVSDVVALGTKRRLPSTGMPLFHCPAGNAMNSTHGRRRHLCRLGFVSLHLLCEVHQLQRLFSTGRDLPRLPAGNLRLGDACAPGDFGLRQRGAELSDHIGDLGHA